MSKFKRLAILNPNTNRVTTELMVNIAKSISPEDVIVEGHSMLLGPTVVTDEKALAASALQIIKVGKGLAEDGVDAILIAGFGDPGLDALRKAVSIPITGIAEAGMAAASALGGFSIITTTPDLRDSIEGMVDKYGHSTAFNALHITPGSAQKTMQSQTGMENALISIALQCEAEGSQSVLIGGGPLAVAAKSVSDSISVPVIEPVSAGVKLSLKRLGITTKMASIKQVVMAK